MIIRDLISLLLGIPAFWLVLRYNMHMFQLNTYMNNEQREWLRRNSHLQWILNFAVVLGIIRLAGRAFISVPWLGLAGDILIWFTFIVIILVYRLMVEMNSKKPLKFTPRVKRMVASDIALCVLLLVIPVAVIAAMGLLDTEAVKTFPLGAFLMLLTGLQKVMIMVANKVNRPIEKGVNNHYINDAKRILKENPDLTIIGVTGNHQKIPQADARDIRLRDGSQICGRDQGRLRSCAPASRTYYFDRSSASGYIRKHGKYPEDEVRAC